MSINKIMNTGKVSLSAIQTGLSTVSHNISNVNTEGYSRQRVDFVAGVPTSQGNVRLGGGVRVGTIGRSTSEFTNRRIEEETTSLGMHEGISDVLSQLETVMRDDGETGTSSALSKFFNTVRTLSTQPESQPLRTAVVESAKSLTNQFHSVVNGVEQIRVDLDRRIEGGVADVNQLTARIADLNRRITEVEVGGNTIQANDERDSRDLALKQLSKLVDVQVTPIEHGGINVSATGFGVLVNGTTASEFRALRGSDDYGAASMRIHQVGFNGEARKDVTDLVSGGMLGGYVRVRDETIPGVMDNLDELATQVVNSVNSVHRDAYNVDGEKGLNFFSPLAKGKGAANVIAVSNDIVADTGKIAGAYKKNAAGDNRALLDLTDLQDKKLFDGGKATFADHAALLVGNVGVKLKAANENLETQRGLIEQLDTVQKRIAGVSLDEEALQMLQFQKAFDANAKMIQVADNLMDTVLNLKRF